MDRRQFVSLSAALLASPLAVSAAGSHVDYTPEAYASALASGKPLLLDFYADW